MQKYSKRSKREAADLFFLENNRITGIINNDMDALLLFSLIIGG